MHLIAVLQRAQTKHQHQSPLSRFRQLKFPDDRRWEEEQCGDQEHGDYPNEGVEEALFNTMTLTCRIPEVAHGRALKNQDQHGQESPHGGDALQEIAQFAQPCVGKQSDVEKKDGDVYQTEADRP